ncbi:hypothetical protein CC2G_004974 [Coprinopsis cinerea AmutBmut pab1-1]|nr:hypothetical protein CC2G_004974 [Coprinopsis cinerea AmutBmut pab1-1]
MNGGVGSWGIGAGGWADWAGTSLAIHAADVVWCGRLGMVSKAHPSAARACESSSPSCGEWEVRNLSIRQEEKDCALPLPEKGNGEDSVWLTGGGPSSAIEREVLRL